MQTSVSIRRKLVDDGNQDVEWTDIRETQNVINNRTRTVGVDETLSVGNDRSRQVGSNESVTVGQSMTIRGAVASTAIVTVFSPRDGAETVT